MMIENVLMNFLQNAFNGMYTNRNYIQSKGNVQNLY